MRLLVPSLAVTVASVVLAAACASPPAPTEPAASAAAQASVAAPSQSAEAATFPPDTYARVLPEELIFHTKPGLTDEDEPFELVLIGGDDVLVLDAPTTVDGVDWYPVTPAADVLGGGAYDVGWIPAVGEGGVPTIEPRTVDCPPLPATDVDLMGYFGNDHMYYEITCWRNTPITFQARLGTGTSRCEEEQDWTWDPGWLGTCRGAPHSLAPVDVEFADISWFYPSWQPGVDLGIAPEPGTEFADQPIVEITGTFDHPAARTCRNRLLDEDSTVPEPDPVRTVFLCRVLFVVTSMREVG
jgi:hypothetical protein